jgi:hypothetical protein
MANLNEMGKAKKWIGGAVKHPLALTDAAKSHGRSKLQEAEVESHSKNTHVRGRGLLGLRFMKHEV